MEKELEQVKGGSESEVALKKEDNIGVVRIADDVVAMIASIAATEVEGVSALAGNITNELMSRVGMKKLSRGVKVEIHDGVVKVDLAVSIQFGYHIPEVSRKLQSKVKSAIENMTGLTCGNVDVRFSNVTMK